MQAALGEQLSSQVGLNVGIPVLPDDDVSVCLTSVVSANRVEQTSVLPADCFERTSVLPAVGGVPGFPEQFVEQRFGEKEHAGAEGNV